ncbi:uncharacterized protein LOC142994303 [Genypterus blacodes]|uniref:uncharacterized protein LOC142994303 n=1 Tax=Genypterus blacodes TaxID=154954 RepID=UPI003F767677
MPAVVHKEILVTLALLFLSQTGIESRALTAESRIPSVTLPDWGDSEYVTQCFYSNDNTPLCDWTRTQPSTGVNTLESSALGLQGEACLEFWYLAPIAAEGSELRVLLKSSTGLIEIWSSPALAGDAWRQVFVPLYLTEEGAQVVLEFVQASTGGQVITKLIGVRRGQCGQQCESDTEFWTDESTHCLCSAGQLSCSSSQCPEGQICGPQRKSSSGISTAGTCTIHSHTDCSSFDGALFRFMAPCTYVLAKTCSSFEALPVFSVDVINGQNGNSSVSTVQQVNVGLGNLQVSLLERQTHRAVVNGVWRKLPLRLNGGAMKIQSNRAAIVLQTSFGLSVSYDNAGAVHVTLPSSFSDKVCGLCGNFNHLRTDDYRTPDGTTASDATALAKSWQLGESTSSCETILIPHHCDPLDEAAYASELNCGGLLSTTGPFSGCLSVLGSESYFRGCMAGMCSSNGDPAVVCETLQIYADICQEAGVAVPSWRNSSFCPLQCGENSHYNSCAEGCPEVCSSQDLVGSCGSCEERCECDSGFKLSGGRCVPAEHCGCWINGKHFERGARFMEGECLQQCQCMSNNVVHCTETRCAKNEVCKVKDGVKDCFPFEPTTCMVYGDPHYITFDKTAYDFQGGCDYILTTTSGEESLVQFTVTGHNMYPPLQNFSRSKLEAVALQVEDLHLTLNQSGMVYVHNSHVNLPYSTNGTYGSLWVYKRNQYIILEATFGLRMIIDTQNRLFLQVDEHYLYELWGLCGTFSAWQGDDFLSPDGTNATNAFDFGDSWKVPGNNECVSRPNDPRTCDTYEEETEAYDKCSAILRDAFKPCHATIHPSTYINSCVYDYCDTFGDQHTLCESLESYVAACEVAGVELSYWQNDTACAEPPTFPTLPPTTTSSSSTPDQTLCPFNCNFDKNLCGWEQLIQDSFDWTRHSGPTPSKQTGPNQDHTTGEGSYMYIEGDSVIHGDSARLISSKCHYTGPLCLHFWYHMYGSATAMGLNIYLLQENRATKVWSKKSSQGPEWLPGYIDVTGPFQIIVEGVRGSNAESDVAIDDISIHFGKCSGIFPGLVSVTTLPPTTAEFLPTQPICNFDCSFASNLCSWNQMVTDAFDWTWQSGSTPTLMTGPSADHTGDGHYLYIEANTATHGDTARLISSECSDPGPQCLQFWYHMYGSADTMGLHVYLLQGRLADAVWWKRNDQGNVWHLAQVDFTTTGAFQIIIEGRIGSNDQSDVAIDDVKLYRGRCSGLGEVTTIPPHPDLNSTIPPNPDLNSTDPPSPPLPMSMPSVTSQPPIVNVTLPPIEEATTDIISNDNVTHAADGTSQTPPHSVCQLHCDFEQDLCAWNQMPTDVFDWTWHSGSTPTMMTGPSSDHTTGDGHYVYIEANTATHGDTSRLISSECSDPGPQCLQFWYHMYGSADTMGLHVYLLQGRLADAVWWKRNDQGNVWHLAQVDFTTTGAFQIIIEGRIGSNDQSDVAIDDVKLYRGRCSGLGEVTTIPPHPDLNSTIPPNPDLNSTIPPNPDLNSTIPPNPDLNSTDPPSPPLPTAMPSVTSQPPIVNVTLPPIEEATTDIISNDNVTHAPDGTQTSQTPPHSVCQLHCDFEQDLCAWNQMPTDVFDWTLHSGSTPTMMTGPSSDHTTGDGHYLYIEGNSATHGDTARLISSECSDPGPQCLQFWYHMYGSADTMGLHVYLLQGRLADAVWWKRNDQGNVWHLAQVDFTTTGAFQIIIEGRIGSNDQSDVAIDDVKLHRGRCSGLGEVTTIPPHPDLNSTIPPNPDLNSTIPPNPDLNSTIPPNPDLNSTDPPSPPLPTAMPSVTSQPPIVNVTLPPIEEATTDIISNDNVTHAPDGTQTSQTPPHSVCQLHCDFEQDLCAWNQMPTDVFDWTLHSGSTPTMMTGPSSDHTTGDGHYLYIEGNSATHGDTARLISSECSDPGPQCLQFWYHMYGSADTMGLHVYLLQDRLADAVWWKRNDQGNVWHLAQVDFTTTGAFHVIFEGRRGSNDKSDIAIDDISLHRGRCADLVKPTTPGPVTTTNPDVPVANTTTTAQPLTSTAPQPQSTTMLTTIGTTTTEATTDCDTQTTATPSTTILTTTTNPDVSGTIEPVTPTNPNSSTQNTEGPLSTTTGRPQPTTTNGPQPTITGRPLPSTTGRPQHTTTGRPQYTTTGRPQHTTTGRPQHTTTGRPQYTTTGRPQYTTTGRPQHTTTGGPQHTTTGRPQYTTTGRPQHTTTGRPQYTTTGRPQYTTTGRPQHTTTGGPQHTTTGRPQYTTTGRPQHTTTGRPQYTTTGRPQYTTTGRPQYTTTGRPQHTTTGGPQHTTTGRPQYTTTGRPQHTTTGRPQYTTTGRPQHTTTGRPQYSTTGRPQYTTTGRPLPSTTGRPQPTSTAEPQPTTTAGPQPTTTRPQPPSTPVPTPSCPRNSHYSTCISACTPTCKHLYGPPGCNEDEPCIQGCKCNEGFVLRQRVCVPIQQCGCVDRNGNKYNFNEVWYTSHCSKKCECEKDDGVGKIDCDDEDECDGNSVCLPNMEGQYYCKPADFTECTIERDPEYRTFDNMKHDFEGEHSYVLVQTTNLLNNLPELYIEGINTHIKDEEDDSHHDKSSEEDDSHQNSRERRDDDDDDDDDDSDESESHEKHHRLRELKIRVYNQTVEFKENRRLFLNGRKTNTPVSPTGGLTIRERSSRIYLKTDFGLSVKFDGRSTAEIILPHIYRDKVRGLCGNFDGKRKNDMMKPDGTQARNVQEFGDSWRVKKNL